MSPDRPAPARARWSPVERYGVRVTLSGLALVLLAIPFASLTFQVLGEGSLTRLDGRLADELNAWVHHRPAVVRGLQAVSFLGLPLVLFVVVAFAAGWLWRPGRHRTTLFLVVTSLGGGLVNTLVKALVDRPRPVVDHPVATALGESFPSGHAMGATVAYGALLVAVWPLLGPGARRWARIGTVLLVLAVGTSRLLLGVHFLSDVVGGFVLGSAWLAAAVAAFDAWRRDEAVEDAADAPARSKA